MEKILPEEKTPSAS
jgi:hypothetical protein